MDAPPIDAREAARLRALVRLRLLDTPPEQAFDECVALAVRLTGARRAAVSLVDEHRQWFKATFGGLPAETPREISFCTHAVAADDVLVVPNASKDPRFADNPLVTSGEVQAYAGVPLHSAEGEAIGTLCVLHDAPLELGDRTMTLLCALAECLEVQLDLRLVSLRLAAHSERADDELERLEAQDEQRRSLSAMLVHDARTPLMVAQASASYLRELDLEPDARDAVDAVLASTEAAHRLLSDFLDLSRAEAEALRLRFERADLAAIAKRVARRMAYLLEATQRRIVIGGAAADATASVDVVLVERTLRNLLDNAVKYSPRDVFVSVIASPTRVEIAIEDEGEAIAEHQRERIFEPDYRIDPDAARGGHGLGLAFCKKAVELHQGSIHVEPALGRGGNRFVVSIPRAQSAPST